MADRFPSPFEMAPRPAPKAGRSCTATRRSSPRTAASSRTRCSGSWTACTPRRSSPPWDATVLDYAITYLSAVHHPALRHPAGAGRRHPLPQRLHVPLARCRSPTPRRSAPASRSSPSAPASTSPTGPRLYDDWMVKIKGVIAELEAVHFEALPHREDMAVLTEGRGIGSGQLMLIEYDKLVQLTSKLWAHHFEFLNLGYAAYLDFFGFCKQALAVDPRPGDRQDGRRHRGGPVPARRGAQEARPARGRPRHRRPDQQRRRGHPDGDGRRRRRQEVGRRLGERSRPVVQLLLGLGLLPLRPGVGRLPGHPHELHRVLRRGARPRREPGPPDRGRRRGRARPHRRGVLRADRRRRDRATFEGKLGLARTVFPYVENHNFYVEHWGMSQVWGKMRQLGQVLTDAGFFAQADDIFLLRRTRCRRRSSTTSTAGRSACRRAARSTGAARSPAARRSSTRSARCRPRRPSASRRRSSPSRSPSCSGASRPTPSRRGSAATTAPTARSTASPRHRAWPRARPASSCRPTASPTSSPARSWWRR